MRWVLRIAIIFGLLVTGVGLSAFATWQGWFTRAADQSVLASRLSSHMRIYKPEGDGPFPTVLQFHGCGSALASQDEWAEFFVEHNYAAIIVDSLTPRNIGREEAIATVCTGMQLTSLERAGDILAALHAAREMPFVDQNNLFLSGWSHGGWAIMDLFSLDLSAQAPPTVTTSTPADLAQVRGAILIYPYCGFPSRSLAEGWQTQIPTLMLMGERDTIAPARQCLPIAERLTQDGVQIRSIVFENAGHDFDVSRHERFHSGTFDAVATAAAREEALVFLRLHREP